MSKTIKTDLHPEKIAQSIVTDYVNRWNIKHHKDDAELYYDLEDVRFETFCHIKEDWKAVASHKMSPYMLFILRYDSGENKVYLRVFHASESDRYDIEEPK